MSQKGLKWYLVIMQLSTICWAGFAFDWKVAILVLLSFWAMNIQKNIK